MGCKRVLQPGSHYSEISARAGGGGGFQLGADYIRYRNHSALPPSISPSPSTIGGIKNECDGTILICSDVVRGK